MEEEKQRAKNLEEVGFLEEAIVHYLAEQWEERELKANFELLAKYQSLLASDKEIVFNQQRLKTINKLYLKKMSAGEVAQRSFAFAGEYQALINDRGENFWLNVIASVQDDLEGFWQIETICEILFSYEIPLKQKAQEFLEDGARAAIFLALASAWHEFLNTVSTEEGGDSLSEQIVKRFLLLAKKELKIQSILLEQSLKICVFSSLERFRLKDIVSFITRERLISRVENLMKVFS